MSLTEGFNLSFPVRVGGPVEPIPAKASASEPEPRRKREPPFSIRLSAADRARLAEEAAGAPLGAYIKAKLQGADVSRKRRKGLSIQDREALAKALALLGGSRLSSNLNQLAHAAHIGALAVGPDIEAELLNAVQDVRAMRRLLMQALGLKVEDQP